LVLWYGADGALHLHTPCVCALPPVADNPKP